MVSMDELQMSEEQKAKYYEMLYNNELLDKEITEITSKIGEDLKSLLENKDLTIGSDLWMYIILFMLFYGDKK